MTCQRDKVSDVIEVLSVMKSEHQKYNHHQNTTSLRKLSTRMVAEIELENNRYKNLKSAMNTIHDALARRLQPDINNITEFDSLADKWLRNGSIELKNILLGYTLSRTQSEKVEYFFTNS